MPSGATTSDQAVCVVGVICIFPTRSLLLLAICMLRQFSMERYRRRGRRCTPWLGYLSNVLSLRA